MIRAGLLLLAVAWLACWPQAGLQDWTGTEDRRVQIAQEMVRSGDLWQPTLGGAPTYNKPPLHYWLLMAARALFGDGYTALRLPAIVLVWLLGWLAYALHRRPFGAGAAWAAALGVLCSPLVVAQFPSAEIDPTFACFTAASLWCLAYGIGQEHRLAVVAAGVLGGLALLTKGPPYLVFAAGAWLVWWRHRRARGWLPYLLPLLLVPAGYYVPLLLANERAGDIQAAVGDETFGRLLTWGWQHVVDTPWFWLRAFLVQVPLVFWCFWEWRSTRDARMSGPDVTLRMCSGAAVFAVIVLSLFPGKPTRYLLPNVPLFVFAVAPAVAHYARQRGELSRLARVALHLVGAFGALLLIAVPFLPPPSGRTVALALAAAMVPWLVQKPRALVAMCLWLPVLAAWTLLADRAEGWPLSGRARAVHGPLLRRELEALGATGDLQTFGHLKSGLLLGAGILPPGDETALRPVTARFVLREDDRDPPLPALPGYTERLRLCLPGEVFVLEERSGR